MTLTREGADAPPVPEGHVRLTIDDRVIDAPKGELLIRACERLGIIVPRFCDHPLLEPLAGADDQLALGGVDDAVVDGEADVPLGHRGRLSLVSRQRHAIAPTGSF